MLSVANKVKIKAIANEWMSSNLNGEKRHLSSAAPEYDERNGEWIVNFVAKHAQNKACGSLRISADLTVVKSPKPAAITRRLERLLRLDGGVTQTPPTKNKRHTIR